MPKTIQQTLKFAAPPRRVFQLYADPKLHAAVTGAPAKFTSKAGSKFSAHQGYITGRLLAVDSPRLIVQTWRAANWKASEADSVLVLSFEPDGKGTRMRMVHSLVHDPYATGIREGWHAQYWDKWRAYLKSR